MKDSHRVEVEAGVALEVEAAPPSENPVLVLSNSLGANLGMWDEVIAGMSADVRILRYDSRGHGKSDLGGRPPTIEELGCDVIDILDAFEIPRAVFCGVSLGGLTGQWLGAMFPERFDGLILANTAPNFPPASMWQDRARTARDRGLQELVGPTIDRWFTKDFQVRRPERVAEIADAFIETSAEGYARCCDILATTDLIQILPKISIPVRVICGEYDPSTPPVRASEIVAAIPNADLVTLDSAHISAIETCEGFSIAVREFIERVTSVPRQPHREKLNGQRN
ncbi:3-oxoadipate enol-lactonase [Bradyrhizobium tropiciagri]|uniref:3-oxoadipate enol-lactonase n=1 Tax=Bradyrhizobium tropiciagri TaxID=312253 RepID=UPI001BA7EF4E|nr:3-oxoadipate enol-lactonase [Bradyrhizobium tropiciagri]MBR0898912.1 3-oxoadipate enol-lactonase [Bradyrhizobium tropiciagri]